MLAKTALVTAIAASLGFAVPAGAIPITFADFRVPLPGTTVAMRPELAGSVIADEITPYFASNPQTQQFFEGELQSRVVRRTSTGTLDFYWRIRPGSTGSVAPFLMRVSDFDYASPVLDVDYRIDSLGDYGPANAWWLSTSQSIEFILIPGCSSIFLCPYTDDESLFFFAGTDATSFRRSAVINLVAGPNVQQFGIPTFSPGVPEPASWALMIAGFGLIGASLRRRRKTVGAVTTG